MPYPKTITIVAVIPEKKDLPKADWVWKAHKNKKITHGMRITHIGAGNIFEQLEDIDDLKDQLKEAESIGSWYNKSREDKILALEKELANIKKENT